MLSDEDEMEEIFREMPLMMNSETTPPPAEESVMETNVHQDLAELGATDIFANLNAWVQQAARLPNAPESYLHSNCADMFENQESSPYIPFGDVDAEQTSVTTNNLTESFAEPRAEPPEELPAVLPAVPPEVLYTVTPAAIEVPAIGGLFQLLDDKQQAEVIRRNGGYEYKIAPFWKRLCAEFIDFIFLMVLKVLIINIFYTEAIFEFRKAILPHLSELPLLQILSKIITLHFVGVWISTHGGTTPGKELMKLRVLHAEAVLLLEPAQQLFQINRRFQGLNALIFPATAPTFRRSLIRVLLKNISCSLSIMMLFSSDNHTLYDTLSKTVVVEMNGRAIFRRPRA